MAVTGHEHTSFTFPVFNGREHDNFTFSVLNSCSSAVNKLVLLLLLFNFYFYFHFIIKIFCFVLKINEMNLFPVQ